MTAKKGSNDFLQILMMTFYLMAIFFGCWGAFYHFHMDRRELAQRSKENQNLSRLELFCSDKANQDTFLQWKRVKESGDNSGDLPGEVASVYQKHLPGLVVSDVSDRPPARVGQGLMKRELTLKFQPAGLQQGLLHFIHQVEVLLPHVEFTKVKFTNKARRGEDGKLWDSEYRMLTYIAEGQ